MKRIFLLFVTSLMILGCQKDRSSSKNKTIHYPLSNEIETLDPAISYDTVSAVAVYQIYETLFEYDYLKRPYSIKPLLAEKMPVMENDGLRYIIKIKKGVKYHKNKAYKNRTVKAQDFINQIKRIAFVPTKSPGFWLFEGKIKGIDKFRKEVGSDFEKFLKTSVEGLKAKDDHTLIIELEKPFPQILYAFAMSFSTPIPIEAIKTYKNELSAVDVGTGPFYLSKWNKSLELTLLKNKDYREAYYPRRGDRYANEKQLLKYAGKRIPILEKIQFQIMKESQTRWLNFLSDKVDILVLNKDNYKVATNAFGELNKELKEKNIKLQVAPTLTYWWLAFNMKDKVLGNNLNLRKAISTAINVDEYIKVFTNNVGQKANSIYPPGVPGYNPSYQLPYSYNLEKAKAFLKIAGYPNGKGLPELSYDVRGNSTSNRQMGEFIQKELAKIGVKVNIQVNTFPGFLKKLRTGQLQFWLGGWALDYPDAENIVQLLHGNNKPPGPNSTSYSNEEVNKLIDQISVMQDNALKFELMEKVQKKINNDLPWSMLYYSRNNIVHHNRVKNYRYSDLIYNYFKYLDVIED